MPTIPPVFAPILYLPGLLYEALIRIRNRMYACGRLPQYQLSCPVISIGNITMGGTGKTPFVLYTARTLAQMGLNAAILTRGYGRKNSKQSIFLSPGQTRIVPEEILGDEPALLRRHLPEIWMGIAKDRFRSGRIIEQQNNSIVFILDDGFQHRKLHRNLDIVLIDPLQPLENNCIVPRGTLREPVWGLQRADILVVNGLPSSYSSALFEARLRKLVPKSPIFFCTQYIHDLIPFTYWVHNERLSMSPDLPKTAFLVTAIGNPERFHDDIRRMGIDIRGMRKFKDHHRFSLKDWRDCSRSAEKCGAETLIITEKDAVKIIQPPEFPIRVAIQSTEIDNPDEFRQWLQSCIREKACSIGLK
jgi:tetraacyldisaccharide 4'-kinase